MEIKGFTYGYGSRRGMLGTERSRQSMDALASLGCNWAALPVVAVQERYCTPRFGFDYRFGCTDREIETAVRDLQARGMKVCLKPMINCSDGIWRARITFPDEDFPFRREQGGPGSYWEEWFSCYMAFICHYAEIAEYTDCGMLCIGCEMIGTERKEEYWRELIGRVRRIYRGPLVYNANHGREDTVPWLDALDYIGTSAYYSVARHDGASVEEMTAAWEEPKTKLKKISEKFGTKILFMEIGCRNARGCAAMPWDYLHRDLPRDEDEQANFYESALRAMSDEPYFDGFFWWDWSTFLPPAERIAGDTSFGIYGKKAEEVVRRWYKKQA